MGSGRAGYGRGVRINLFQTMRFRTEQGGDMAGVSATTALGATPVQEKDGSTPRLDGTELVSRHTFSCGIFIFCIRIILISVFGTIRCKAIWAWVLALSEDFDYLFTWAVFFE